MMQRHLLFLLLLLLAGCGEKIEPGSSPVSSPLISDVPLMTLQLVAETSSETFVGTVESLDRAAIIARGSGIIERFAVREGDAVQSGQLLVRIADDPLLDQLRVAEATVVAAEKQLATSLARQALAEQTADRYQQLWDQQALTAQEYDQIKADREVARQQAALAAAEVERAAAGRAAAKRQSQYHLITAPFSGQVLSLQARPGSTALPGTPLLVIDRAGNRLARIKIPERLRGSITVGTPLQLELPALQRHFNAEVTRIQPGSDNSSRSFDALLQLPDSQDLPTGLFVRAIHRQGAEQLLLIPDSAVTSRGQLTGVFLAQDGVLHFRLVRLGRSFGEQHEVLSGLQAGDRLVSADVKRVFDGARLE